LAKQTHEQLFFPKAVVAGRRAPALKGHFTTEQALALLLAATDIAASHAGPEPPPRPEIHLPQQGAALEREVLRQSAVVEELQKVGEDHVDLDVAEVPRARLREPAAPPGRAWTLTTAASGGHPRNLKVSGHSPFRGRS
jgi:hypothetical protein